MGMRKITFSINDLGTYSFKALPYKTYIQKKASIQEDNSKILNELETVDGKIKVMNGLLVDEPKYFFLRSILGELFLLFYSMNEMNSSKLIDLLVELENKSSDIKIISLTEEEIEIYPKKK